MQITKTILPATQQKKLFTDPMQLKFGQEFSAHMFIMEYKPNLGWHNAEIKPYQPISIDPSANILHYGQQVFEGQKAYRTKNNNILLFRPEENAKRFNRSMQRLCMPEIPIDTYLNSVNELIKIDERWVPAAKGASLYIRPMAFGSEASLGVRAATEYHFCVIMSPVGPYFASGFNPISLWVSDNYVRAVVGGTGEAKTGGNYAAGLIGGKLANEHGCDQVLWLDAKEKRFVEEGGSMNIFFVIDNKLVTPMLSGSILPGITRKSVIELANDFGIPCEERQIDIEELVKGIENKSVSEAFCTGTAAAICPINMLSYKNRHYQIDTHEMPLTNKFYDQILGLQYGEIKDDKNWITTVC